jgi:hypothetical protein
MPTKSIFPTAASLLLAALALPASAHAQSATDPSSTQGIFLNARVGGYGVGYEGDREGTGSGFGLRAGYGFSERLTTYVGLEVGSISEGDGFEGLPDGDDYNMLFVDLGARLHFRRDHRLVPFLEAGGSVVGVWFDNSASQEATYGGASVTVGGGLLYFVSPRVALEGAASFAAGGLMEREIAGTTEDVDMGLAGVRMQVGISYYPFG